MATPGRLRYRRPTPVFDVQSILQLVFKLGIIPEENAQSGRSAPIRFVLPGSLAAKHGLKAGDEITGVNGERFERIEDAAILFGRVRLDHGLRLEIQRAGKRIDITVPAEAFKDFAGPTVRPAGTGRFEVSFRYKPAGKVQSVTLAGTFNNWDMKSRPMTGPDKEGAFTTRLELGPGVYEYKFVLDGKTWQADPINYRRTGQDSNSVLIVGD
jgi:membrane-associated protease RseP (regulator of RpoE activity)